MTPVFCCGFECGIATSAGGPGHWGSITGTGSFTTTNPISGLRSARFNPTAGLGGTSSAFTLSSQTVVGRVKIRFDTLPNANTNFFIDAGTSNGAAYHTADQKIYATGGTDGVTGIAVTTGVIYVIDLKLNQTANPHLIDVSVNGVACGQATRAEAAATITAMRVGDTNNTWTGDIYIDDVLVSVTAGDFPIGNGKVLSFVPNADGTHTSTTTVIVKGTIATPVGAAITSATTDAFNWVDARPILGGATDATRLINQQTNGSTLYAEVDFEATTESSPPRAVEVLTADRQAATQSGGFSTKLNDNGTEDAIITRSAAGVITDRYVTKQYATMVGGGAWTLARFNALKARFGYSGDATPDQYWRGIMIEAEFTASDDILMAAIIM